MSYLYRGYANNDARGPRLVTVTSDGNEAPLRHLVWHSPDGFNWGYAGSGPSELARSIIGHLLETDDPPVELYQAFKFAFIAGLPDEKDWAIHEFTIRYWMATR